ncbi:MAG: DEAD/DEAH box helicase [Sphingomonadales bacterium]
MNNFEALGLSAPLVRALEANNFITPKEIQAEAIPKILAGHDVIGLAQTGGGKTAAFVLPILEQLLKDNERPLPSTPKALILAPTRELAQQITECVKIFSRDTDLSQVAIYGGAPYGPQMKALRRGVDILIATPGRLMDHIKRKNIFLQDTPHFVLDEADKMLEMGFVEEVEKIIKILPQDRKTTMFSATINRKVENLASRILNNPTRVEIKRKDVVSSKVSHKVMFMDFPDKRELLSWLIEKEQPEAMLVFTRTKSDADKLSESLRDEGHRVDALHGDKKQAVRDRVLRKFRNGEIRILVATDVAARGIDVPSISHVINMTLPKEIEGYVHRVGRTGRGEAIGVAYTFCDRQDRGQLKHIEHYIKTTIEVVKEQPFHDENIANGVRGGKGKRNTERKPFKSKSKRPRVDELNNVRGLTTWKENARKSESKGDRSKFEERKSTKFLNQLIDNGGLRNETKDKKQKYGRPKFEENSNHSKKKINWSEKSNRKDVRVEKTRDGVRKFDVKLARSAGKEERVNDQPRESLEEAGTYSKLKSKKETQQRWEDGSNKKVRSATKIKSLKKAKKAALKLTNMSLGKKKALKKAKANRSNGGSKIFKGRKAA